jgi:hypothetical protein
MSHIPSDTMPLPEYMALLRSGKVVNFWAQPGMNERGVKDFWDRHLFGTRYLGPGHIIDFADWRERLRAQEDGDGNRSSIPCHVEAAKETA